MNVMEKVDILFVFFRIFWLDWFLIFLNPPLWVSVWFWFHKFLKLTSLVVTLFHIDACLTVVFYCCAVWPDRRLTSLIAV